MRQRILFIVLLVVVVLVGYTVFRPKPRPKARAEVGRKPATPVQTIRPTAPTSTPAVARPELKSETLKTQLRQKDTMKARPAIALEEKKPESTKPDTTKLQITKKPDTLKLIKEREMLKWGTDPFIRDWVLATEIKDLRLKAVTISGTKAYALINDQIFEKGEAIMGKRIIAIEKDKVILEQGGRQFTLFLGE